MKKNIILLLTALMAFMIASCTNPNLPGEVSDINAEGTVQFSWSQPGQANNSRSSFSRNVVATGNNIQDAKKVVISIEAADGTVVHNKKELKLFNFNGSFLSEPLSLKVGTYKLTEYLLLDAAGTIIYATPKAGSAKAHLVANPLPVNFTIAKDMATSVKPEVVDAAEITPPELGYIGFDFVEVKKFDFLVSVMIYDASADSFIMTDAALDLTTDTKSYNFNLAPATNKLTVNEMSGTYTLTLKKAGYEDYRVSHTAAELKAFFQTPLVITPVKTKVITFADPSVEKFVRTAINKQTGDIYSDEVTGVTSLFIHSGTISDLSGLEHLTSLNRLTIFDSTISDLSPLAPLTNLTEIFLRKSNISDLSPLATVKKLNSLSLINNKIVDITPLASLTELTYLQLSDNNISDISALASLPKLTRLYLNNNRITDITALSGVKSLTRLELENNTITDITPLAGLAKLNWIILTNNRISDLSVFANYSVIERLYLGSNNISDLSPLSGLKTIEQLILSNNNISDLTPLSKIYKVMYINLNANNVSDLTPLTALTGLTNLHINQNKITNLTPLSKFTYMVSLELNNNNITDLSPISGMTRLIHLKLSNNSISDIGLLQGMTQLQTIELSYNNISSINALQTLPRLRTIELRSNKISDIAPLVNNQALVSNPTLLGFSITVELRENPLSTHVLNVQIPALQAREVIVYYQ